MSFFIDYLIMIDFLLLYEHKRREAENCALLAEELCQRGYSVKILCIYSPLKYFTKAEVVIVPHLYNNQQLLGHCKNFWMSNRKIISLQYEQSLRVIDHKNSEAVTDPKEQAKYAHHTAWGQAQIERYKNCGIAGENIHETGFISMDLLKPLFNSCFMSKEELGNYFSIDPTSEWVLFVSSFSHADLESERIKEYMRDDPYLADFYKFNNASYPIILDWLRRAAIECPEKVFVYRPHPSESIEDNLREIEKELPNFHVISDFSMRQWVKVTDKVLNWVSTSEADLYFLGKTSVILRPIEMPAHIEMAALEKLEKCTTYDKLIEKLKSNGSKEGVTNPTTEYFFGKRDNGYAFIKVADLAEKLFKDELKGYDFNYGKSRWNMAYNQDRVVSLKTWLYIPFYFITMLFGIKQLKHGPHNLKYYVSLWNSEIRGVNQLITEYRSRFKGILKDFHSNNI